MRSMVEGASASKSQGRRCLSCERPSALFSFSADRGRGAEAPSTVLLRRTVPLPRCAGAESDACALRRGQPNGGSGFDLIACQFYSAAMAAAFSSLRARRYSTGMTLRNFGYQCFQSARILAATVEPVKRAWRAIR
jgi:hypothetical protein